EDAVAAAGGLRSGDEEVDELVRVARGLLGFGHELEERTLQLLDPRAGRGGDPDDTEDALFLDPEARRLGLQVDLVQDDHLRPPIETGTVRGQLGVDRPPAVVRVLLARVDDVKQEASTLEVREELVT